MIPRFALLVAVLRVATRRAAAGLARRAVARIRAAIAARRVWPDPRPDWGPGELLALGAIPSEIRMRGADARRRAARRLADR